MAAGIQPQGFQLQVMPNVQLANPAFFNAGTPLAQGLGSGVGLAGQIQQQQLQRALAEREAAMAPIQMEAAQMQLAEAQRKAAIPDIIWGNSRLIDNNKMYPAALEVVVDEVTGQPILGDDNQPLMRPSGEGEIEIGNLDQEDIGTEYLPGGVTRSVTRRKTLKTASDRKMESDNRESIIAQRAAQAEAAQERLRIQEEYNKLRAENEANKLELARTKVESALNDPNWKTVSTGVKNGNLVFNQINGAGQLRSIESDQQPRTNNSFFGTVNMGQPQQGGGQATPPSDNLNDILAGKYGAGAGKAPASQADNPLQLSGKDLDAYNWAISNPNDARAAKILTRLGGQ